MSLANVLGPRPPAFAFALRDLRRALRMFADGVRFVVRRPALAGATVSALVFSALLMSGAERLAVAEAPPAPAPARWIDISRPLPMYGFEAPELARTALSYAVRRKSDDSAREDVLTFGAFADKQAFVRLTVRRGAPEAGATFFFVEAARRAAEAGLALDRLGQPAALKTRFGDGEFAEAKLATATGESREGCQAFAVASGNPELRIAGLACGPDGKSFERRRLACLVGRLDLLGAGDDLDLKAFFAQAELRRDPSCPTRSRAAFADASWVDERHAAPALRGGQKR